MILCHSSKLYFKSVNISSLASSPAYELEKLSKNKRKAARGNIRSYWCHDRVINLLLRTVHLAFLGKYQLPGSGATGGSESLKDRKDVNSPSTDPVGPAAAAAAAGPPALEGDIAAGICTCLMRLQTLLADGKPAGGWKSEGLKSLREAVVRGLGFR